MLATYSKQAPTPTRLPKNQKVNHQEQKAQLHGVSVKRDQAIRRTPWSSNFEISPHKDKTKKEFMSHMIDKDGNSISAEITGVDQEHQRDNSSPTAQSLEIIKAQHQKKLQQNQSYRRERLLEGAA